MGAFARGGDDGLHRRVAELGQVVAQQHLDDRRLTEAGQHVADGVGDAAAHGDQAAVLGGGVAGAVDQVGVADAGGDFEKGAGHVDMVAQQQAQDAAGDFVDVGQAPRHPGALVGGRLAQHLNQQVGGHGAFEGVHPAAGQADHVGQPLQQAQP